MGTKMTSEYSQLGSGQLYQAHNFENVNEDISQLYYEIKKCRSTGDYKRLKELIESLNITLNKNSITSKHVNAISEELRNMEIISKEQKEQTIFYGSAIPSDIRTNDIWIGGAL